MITSQVALDELIERTAGGGLGPEAVAERIAATLTPPERAAMFKACLRAYCREVLRGKADRVPVAAPVERAYPDMEGKAAHPWRLYPEPLPEPASLGMAGAVVSSCSCGGCGREMGTIDAMLEHRANPGRCYLDAAVSTLRGYRG